MIFLGLGQHTIFTLLITVRRLPSDVCTRTAIQESRIPDAVAPLCALVYPSATGAVPITCRAVARKI